MPHNSSLRQQARHALPTTPRQHHHRQHHHRQHRGSLRQHLSCSALSLMFFYCQWWPHVPPCLQSSDTQKPCIVMWGLFWISLLSLTFPAPPLARARARAPPPFPAGPLGDQALKSLYPKLTWPCSLRPDLCTSYGFKRTAGHVCRPISTARPMPQSMRKKDKANAVRSYCIPNLEKYE